MTEAFILDEAPGTPRLSGPTDLVVATPYLLGFVPSSSVVALACTGPGVVALTARFDLPPPDLDIAEWVEALAKLRRAVHLVGAASVALLCYPPEEMDNPFPYELQLAALAKSLDHVELIDALCVRTAPDGTSRVWSYCCEDDGCCPAGGLIVDGTSALDVRAAFVASGHSVAADRATLAHRFAATPVELARKSSLTEAIALGAPGRGREWRARSARLICGDLRAASATTPVGSLTTRQFIRLARGCADRQVRDVVLAEITRMHSRAALDVLIAAVRVVPDDHRAALAATVAAAAYLVGDGALAWDALDQVGPDGSGHVLAGLIWHSLASGLPPKRLADAFLADMPRAAWWDGRPIRLGQHGVGRVGPARSPRM